MSRFSNARKSSMRAAYSQVTGQILVGRVAAGGSQFLGASSDITNDALSAVCEMLVRVGPVTMNNVLNQPAFVLSISPVEQSAPEAANEAKEGP